MAVTYLERPAAGEPVGALVFFHGHWGDERQFLPFLDELDPERRLHGYTPRGPIDMDEGRARWDGWRMEDPTEELGAVAEWLDSLPYERGRLVLAGFSQGAWVAYALGLAPGRPRPAAIVALAGFLNEANTPLDLTPPFPPIAIAHGTLDEGLEVEVARHARRVLEEAGAEVLYRETAIGHEIDPAVVPELRDFLRRALP